MCVSSSPEILWSKVHRLLLIDNDFGQDDLMRERAQIVELQSRLASQAEAGSALREAESTVSRLEEAVAALRQEAAAAQAVREQLRASLAESERKLADAAEHQLRQHAAEVDSLQDRLAVTVQELDAVKSQRHHEAGELQASTAAEDAEREAESLGAKLAAAEGRLLQADEAAATFTLRIKARPKHAPFYSLACAWKMAFNMYFFGD